jgi:hypothetical protein
MSLTLIEAIAGRPKAETVARDLGLTEWDARHDSGAFRFTRPFALTAMGNTLAFWNREQLAIQIAPGDDEVSLALVADAWSRTYRSHVTTFASTAGAIETRNGVRIIPDRVSSNGPSAGLLPSVGDRKASAALDDALDGIQKRYGVETARTVAMQLEYPQPIAAP